MTEIKKITKIALGYNAIVTFLFAILLIFLTELFLVPLTGWTNPLSPRNFGGLCLLSAIFSVILLRKKEWEEIKLTYAFIFSFFTMTIPIELIVMGVLWPTLSVAAISQTILNQILMISIFSLGVLSYYKQQH
ncbi:MAG: hypothetical protein KGD73_01640 [Candidatus Lokiarchaeota archaeon]|nr:hypothetical protein [Candidatus Lokiarchaeota archaeon]